METYGSQAEKKEQGRHANGVEEAGPPTEPQRNAARNLALESYLGLPHRGRETQGAGVIKKRVLGGKRENKLHLAGDQRPQITKKRSTNKRWVAKAYSPTTERGK